MARRKTTAAPSNVIQLPRCGKLDARDALVNHSLAHKPTVPRPSELDAAIEEKARDMAKEAYELCLEYLRSRVAGSCEWNQPRELDVQRAFEMVRSAGDLGDALTLVYRTKLNWIARDAERAATIADEFRTLATQVRAAVKINL